MTLRTVESVMSSPAVTVSLDQTLSEAARRMHDSHVGSVVVTADGCASGMVTERDLLRATATDQKAVIWRKRQRQDLIHFAHQKTATFPSAHVPEANSVFPSAG